MLISVFLVAPSVHNPEKKNYHSLMIFLKRDNSVYEPIEINSRENKRLYEYIQEENSKNIPDYVEKEIYSKKKTKEEVILRNHLDEGSDVSSLNVEESESIVPEPKNRVQLEKVSPIEHEVSEEITKTISEKSLNKKKNKNKESEEVSLVGESEEIKQVDIPDEVSQVNLENEETEERKNNKGKGEGKLRKSVMWGVFGSLVVAGIIFMVMFKPIDVSFNLAKSSGESNEEEALVSALRSFSLKKYDEAMVLFDDIDYNSLEDDDKDVMLLTYLFGDNPKKSIELEPEFDEVVVSYYKASSSMQKIKDLNQEIDSDVLKFEVAVSEGEYERVIELKDSVEMKDERFEEVVNAYLKLDELDEAESFVEGVTDEVTKLNLEAMIEDHVDKKRAIEEKKKNTNKKKKDD